MTKSSTEQFIRDMKSVYSMCDKIIELNLELIAIATQLQGVSSPAFKDVILENAGDPYHDNKTSLIFEEDKLVQERSHYEKRIKDVEEVFILIDEESTKNMMIDLYIFSKNHEFVADKYNYSKQSMYRRINSAIKKAMMLLSTGK